MPNWPDTGPAVVTGQAGEHVYRMPTLQHVTPALAGAAPGDRSPLVIAFGFTEDGQQVVYSATLSQDVLFTALYPMLERNVVT